MRSSNSSPSAAVIGAAIFFVATAYAVDPNRAISQYRRDHWATAQGLPHAPVYAISQTADGYLWIGTGAGLVRFDGFNFRLVQAGPAVAGLIAAPNGCLWLRLEDLTLLRDCDGSFTTSSSRASAMSLDHRGEILIADPQQGALAFHGAAFQLLASAADISRTPPTALAQTLNGDIWIGTRDAGLFRFSENKASPVINVLPGAKINCLLADQDRGLLIGTDDGLQRWSGGEFSAPDPALRGFQVLSMARDRDANLWIGTDSRGLLRVNAQGVARMNQPDGLSRGAITALFEDRERNLWIAAANGLDRLRDTTFVSYSLPEGLPSDGNNPVFVDAENRMWFAPVDGGLWWLKDGQHGKITAPGLDTDVVYSIAGGNGEVWIGRQHGGLTRIRSDHGSFTSQTFTQADGLAQNSVFSVLRSRDGTVWAGTLSAGVSHLINGKFITYTVANGLASNTVSSILETTDGTTWFATPGGLTALSQGRWQTYNRDHGLPSQDINCLLQDSQGLLWIGTAAGLAFRNAQGFHVPPLLNEPVLGIAEDRFGWLWLSTFSHVLRVRRDKLLSGTLTDGDLRQFGLADGLRGVEGVKRNQSVVTDSLGRIWFSLNRGISSVDPARLAQTSAPAIAHIQAIAADNNAVALSPPVHITGGSRRITFSFLGLSLASPEQVRFRYRLDGFDHAWSQPSAAAEASYTNLSPAHYRFRVIASNPEGVWNLSEADVAFQVDPLYWQTWWFALLLALLTVATVAAVYRLRLNQMTRRLNIRFEERLAERTRLARDLHDTLLQTIQGSKMVADDGLDDPADPARVHRALERVSEWLAQAIQEGRAALAALRSSTTQRNDLAEAFQRAGDNCSLTSSVAFALIVEGPSRDLHPIVRDEIYRIGYEAIRNACLHSKGTSLQVHLTYARDLRLRIRDNGIGISPQFLAQGKPGHYGLKGMQERAAHTGGSLRFNTTVSGTEVDLLIPGHVAFNAKEP